MLTALSERTGVPVDRLLPMTLAGWVPCLIDELPPLNADLFPLVLLSVGAASDRLCHGLRSGRHHSIDAKMRSSVRRPILLIVGLLST